MQYCRHINQSHVHIQWNLFKKKLICRQRQPNASKSINFTLSVQGRKSWLELLYAKVYVCPIERARPIARLIINEKEIENRQLNLWSRKLNIVAYFQSRCRWDKVIITILNCSFASHWTDKAELTFDRIEFLIITSKRYNQPSHIQFNRRSFFVSLHVKSKLSTTTASNYSWCAFCDMCCMLFFRWAREFKVSHFEYSIYFPFVNYTPPPHSVSS